MSIIEKKLVTLEVPVVVSMVRHDDEPHCWQIENIDNASYDVIQICFDNQELRQALYSKFFDVQICSVTYSRDPVNGHCGSIHVYQPFGNEFTVDFTCRDGKYEIGELKPVFSD